MRKGIVALALGALITLWATPASAGFEFIEESDKTIGNTTVTWDSSFQDVDYDLAAPVITMTVTWSVVNGTASFKDFVLKEMGKKKPPGYTPRDKDPAAGTAPCEILDDAGNIPGVSDCPDVDENATAGSVEVTFQFTDLHLDKNRNVDIGNAHFKLFLNIDEDKDGQVDSVAGFGVNVHVEDPQ